MPDGSKATVLSIGEDGESVSVQTENGEQRQVTRTELQKAADAQTEAEDKARQAEAKAKEQAQSAAATTELKPGTAFVTDGQRWNITRQEADGQFVAMNEDGTRSRLFTEDEVRQGLATLYASETATQFAEDKKQEQAIAPRPGQKIEINNRTYDIVDVDGNGTMTISNGERTYTYSVEQFLNNQANGDARILQDQPQQGYEAGEEYEPAYPYEAPNEANYNDDYIPTEEYEPSGNTYNTDYTPADDYEAAPMKMPLRQDGEPDYTRATPTQAHQYIYNDSGLTTAQANEYVNNQTAEAKKAVSLIKGKGPKMGTSIVKFKQQQAEYEAKLQAAQSVLDYWNAVKAEQDKATLAQRQDMREAEQKQIDEAHAAEEARLAEERDKSAVQNDSQGNPLNADGTLKTEKLTAIDQLTDEDFTHPTRNIEMSQIPTNVDAAIGAEGKPVVIKKNIFEKNAKAHNFSAEESRHILNAALYNTDIVGQTQPTPRKNHWVVIKLDEESPITVLEVNENKDNVEVVGWYRLDNRNLEKIKRQAEREGGELLILTPKGAAASLSTLPSDLSSDGKSTKQNEKAQKKTLAEIVEEVKKYKEKDPNRVYLVQQGDTYVAVGEDAKTINAIIHIPLSEESQITLTRITADQVNIVLPGLIRAGHKVAISDNDGNLTAENAKADLERTKIESEKGALMELRNEAKKREQQAVEEDKKELTDFHKKTDTTGRTAVVEEEYNAEDLILPLKLDGKKSRLAVETRVPYKITAPAYQVATYDFSDEINPKTNEGWQKWGDLLDEYNS